MIITPPEAVVRSEDVAPDPPTMRQEGITVLENRKEIKSRIHYEKGILVDLYI